MNTENYMGKTFDVKGFEDLRTVKIVKAYLLGGRKQYPAFECKIIKSIDKHRSHFLRLRFPNTYRELIKMGIKNDYSLGYSAVNGFRAGTATPFYFYDLLKEEITTLRVHPFIFMDTAMIDHLRLSPEEAEKVAMDLIDKVKKWGGEAIGIWHNYAMSERGQYAGWQQFFRNTMALANK